ncbi:MAG: hypothetical protein IT320_13165 [Anaerolineae bacterium]|nr:hypothetical protein [Anaerolineae bacterium]
MCAENTQPVRCPSCEGYGWISDVFGDEGECDWCQGIGYVCRDEQGTDHPIPVDQLGAMMETLEALESERLRELGYTGQAKKPWEQAIRQQRGKPLDGKD